MKRVSGPVLLFLFVAATPFVSHAQVVVNEIMYNPAGSDSAREWVELYNPGASDVTMVGGTVKGSWRISDGSNHTLTDPAGGTGRGSLTIPAGGYLVVASDPAEFISGEYQGGAYSAVKSSISLNNTGSTVSIIDGTGSAIDSAVYTSAQGGSDDGSSLQRQADGSWIAALPTPGAANSASAYVPPPGDTGSSQTDTSNSTSNTQTQAQTAAVSSYVPPPTPSLYADAGVDRTVIVGADVEFDASAYDKNQELLDSGTVRFMWNFGDGDTAEGESVLHHYDYPGTYALVLTIAQNKNAAIDEAIVTASAAKLSFSALPDNGVEIDNRAGRDLDLSEWMVRAAPGSLAALFRLPPHSVILSGASLRISRATLGFLATSASELDYPNGVTALAAGQTTLPVPAAPPALPVPAAPVAVKQVTQKPRGVSAGMEIPSVDENTTGDTTTASASVGSEVAAAEIPASPGGISLWWLAAIGLAGLSAIALILAKKYSRKEWDIVEEKAE